GVDGAIGESAGARHRYGQRGVQDDGPSARVHGRNFGPPAGGTFGASCELSVELGAIPPNGAFSGNSQTSRSRSPAGPVTFVPVQAPAPPAGPPRRTADGQAPDRGGGRPYRRPGGDLPSREGTARSCRRTLPSGTERSNRRAPVEVDHRPARRRPPPRDGRHVDLHPRPEQ